MKTINYEWNVEPDTVEAAYRLCVVEFFQELFNVILSVITLTNEEESFFDFSEDLLAAISNMNPSPKQFWEEYIIHLAGS